MTTDPTHAAAPTAGGKPRSPWRRVLYAAVFGALVGYLMVRKTNPQDASPFIPFSPMAFCCYLWIALSLYWTAVSKRASMAKSSESSSSRLLHVVMINAAFVLTFWPFPGWPNVRAHLFVFPRVLPESPILTWLGVLLQVFCFLLALWSRMTLGRNWSGEVTTKVDHQLVREGPYRRIRHPIYTGAIGMYLGPFLIAGRLQGVLALALIAIAYTRKIRMEEQVLSREFGPAYDDYRRQSWAVIPGII